jgi:hypothetical protein
MSTIVSSCACLVGVGYVVSTNRFVLLVRFCLMSRDWPPSTGLDGVGSSCVRVSVCRVIFAENS